MEILRQWQFSVLPSSKAQAYRSIPSPTCYRPLCHIRTLLRFSRVLVFSSYYFVILVSLPFSQRKISNLIFSHQMSNMNEGNARKRSGLRMSHREIKKKLLHISPKECGCRELLKPSVWEFLHWSLAFFLTVLMGKPQKVQKPLQNKQLHANKSSTHWFYHIKLV